MKAKKKIRKGAYMRVSDDLLYSLLELGVAGVLATAPWLAVMSLPLVHNSRKKPTRRQVQNTLDYLRRRDYIRIETQKGQVSVMLTQKGRERAVTTFVRAAPTRRPRSKWDGKWRMLMYDIGEEKRLKRDVLRQFIRRSGFRKLQGSVWIYPFDCGKEVQKLKQYLDLDDNECRLAVCNDIGDDKYLRQLFRV